MQLSGNNGVCALLVFAAFVLLPLGARADTYKITFVAGHPPHLPWVKMVKQLYIPMVNKKLAAAGGRHKIVWTEAYGGTLAKVGGVLEAIQEGIAEMGIVYSLFEPAKLPLQNVTYVTPFGSDDLVLVTKIMQELHDEMPEMAQAWHKYNQVFIAPIGVDTHYLLTKFPVRSIADLKGRKLAGAGAVSLWERPVGIVPVQGNFAVHYNNLKTGVYDGLIAFSTGFYPNKLHEVAKYATKVNFGAHFVGAITINRKFWNSLPPDVQKVLKGVGQLYRQKLASTLTKLAGIFEKKMAAEGVKFSRLPASERSKWAKTMPNIAAAWAKRAEAKGLAGNKVLKAYMDKLRANKVPLVREWDKR